MEYERFEMEMTDQDYSSVLESIKQHLDPESNTALVVDDERGIRKMVVRSLKNFAPNLQIYEATNGKDALEKLAKIRKTHIRDPLLIVLDLNMPIMNGWDFIAELKKEYKAAGKDQGIPIIVLSSTSGEKGALFMKKSVVGGKSGYVPLVAVAKESCVDKSRYDTDERGLEKWLQYFLNSK
jgi:CheY-like chemotaxis protein